jgi:hypothetical protein
VENLKQLGIKQPAMGLNRMIDDTSRIPILNIGAIAMIKRGNFRVLPAVLEILPHTERFANGALHPIDAIIFATGYGSSPDKVIKGFETIADARGIAGLHFVGFKNPPTGALREIALKAPRVAKAIRVAVQGH